MKELTIDQVKQILGITYPTAHRIAREAGRFDETHPPNGIWYIPSDSVYDIIRQELKEARLKESRFDSMIAQLKNGNSK